MNDQQTRLAGFFALLFLACSATSALAAVSGVFGDLLTLLSFLAAPIYLVLALRWGRRWIHR